MSKQKTKTQDSATIQVQTLEAQNKFHETLAKVHKDVENLSTEIANCLKDGLAIKLSNKMIMEIYNVVYGLAENACQIQIQDKKQQNVTKTLETEIQDQYTQFLRSYLVKLREYIFAQPQQAENLLLIFNEHAVNYKAYSFWLKKIYYYLDKFINKGTSLNAISLKQFKIEYFECLKTSLLKIIIHFIQQYRDECIPVPQNLKGIIEFYEIIDQNEVELKYDDDQRKYFYKTKEIKSQKYYSDNLEQPFLKESEKYYLQQIEDNKNLQTIEFVHWANKIIAKEEEIIAKLFPRSQKSLKNKFELHIIKNQSHWLVNHQNGLKYMLQMEQLNEVAALYKFCIRVKESVSHISRAFFEFFDQEGNIINQTEQEIRQGQPKSQAEQAELYFQKIIQLMNRAQHVLEAYMDNNIDIQSSYNSAFGSILNKNDKTPLWLSIYCDMTIRNEKNNTNDVDLRINNILRVFKLIHHRDVFFKHYQKFLSIRLLIPNANLDIEKQLVSKFRGETGTNILSSLSMMINDIDTSRRFQEDLDQGDKYLECNINLISQGCWPQLNILSNVIPPLKIQQQIGVFEQRFKQKFQQREIIWNYGQGTGEINFKTNNRNYQLSVSTLQIVSFTQFNKDLILTVQQIMENTNMTKIDVENSLIPFVCFKIIKREKADLDEFTPDEKLKLDLDYQNKSLRLKLMPNPKMQPTRAQQKQNIAAEEKQMNEEIQKQREYIVDSQIVRLMKSRKTIPHSELIEGCEKTINLFKPETQFIKKRIEHLIDKDYIKRDEKDWNIYHYIN